MASHWFCSFDRKLVLRSAQLYWSQGVTCFVFCTLVLGRSDETRRLTGLPDHPSSDARRPTFLSENFLKISIWKCRYGNTSFLTICESEKIYSFVSTISSMLIILQRFICVGARSFSLSSSKRRCSAPNRWQPIESFWNALFGKRCSHPQRGRMRWRLLPLGMGHVGQES